MLFNLLAGFLGAFAFVRLSTWGIRDNWGPFRNVSVGGRHIHHFVPGILIAFGSGTAALLTDNDTIEDRLAIPMGAGMGLTFDEAALLLDLRDVYWTRQGLLSVQLSLGATAILSIAILTQRMLRRGERRQEAAGEIPQASFSPNCCQHRLAAPKASDLLAGEFRRPQPLIRCRCRSLPPPTSPRRTSRPRNRCWARCWSPTRR